MRVHDEDAKVELLAVNAALGAINVLSTAANALLTTINSGIASLVGFLSPSSTGTVIAPVPVSATDVVILAANANRKGATIFNSSTIPLRIVLANVAADATHFSAEIGADDYYEVPFNYRGVIRGYWLAAGAGNAHSTEVQ